MADPPAMPSLADLSNPSDEVLAALAALSPVPATHSSQSESKPKTPFMSPISISTLPTMQPAPAVMTTEAKEASPDGLSTTTALMEARAHSALEAHSTLNNPFLSVFNPWWIDNHRCSMSCQHHEMPPISNGFDLIALVHFETIEGNRQLKLR